MRNLIKVISINFNILERKTSMRKQRTPPPPAPPDPLTPSYLFDKILELKTEEASHDMVSNFEVNKN